MGIIKVKVCTCPNVCRGRGLQSLSGGGFQRPLCKTRIFGCLLTFFHPKTPSLYQAALEVNQRASGTQELGITVHCLFPGT